MNPVLQVLLCSFTVRIFYIWVLLKGIFLQTTTICVELKREGDKKSHKRIGSVEIDLKPSSPGRATLEEQWYTVKVDKPDNKTCPALRIKHRSVILLGCMREAVRHKMRTSEGTFFVNILKCQQVILNCVTHISVTQIFVNIFSDTNHLSLMKACYSCFLVKYCILELCIENIIKKAE